VRFGQLRAYKVSQSPGKFELGCFKNVFIIFWSVENMASSGKRSGFITDDTLRVLEMLDEAGSENEEISSHYESFLDHQLANESDETR